MRLAGKTALVTGGATGIGYAIATALAGEGCQVAIAGRRAKELDAAVTRFDETRTRGVQKLERHTVDVTDRASVSELVGWTNELFGGRIDILVNNAGVNFPKRTMADMPPEVWDQTMTINATGTYNVMAAVIPQMRERRDGLVINISSVSGKRASPLGGIAYCASKFAMTALGTAVALEEGKNGIRVTSICPGEVDTPILEGRLIPPGPEHRARILKPEDIAAAALMVACLPPQAHVAEIIIKPTWQDYS
jgi:NAD(P)-dependent dehydrogenase (short-subunit alcohol dehydrogenase family)